MWIGGAARYSSADLMANLLQHLHAAVGGKSSCDAQGRCRLLANAQGNGRASTVPVW